MTHVLPTVTLPIDSRVVESSQALPLKHMHTDLRQNQSGAAVIQGIKLRK